MLQGTKPGSMNNEFQSVSSKNCVWRADTPTQYQIWYDPVMSHTIKDKKKLIARIGRIRGQLNGVERALTEEKDCYLILQTVAACHGALNSLMGQILEGHIRSHLLDTGPGKGAGRRRAAREVIDIINAFLR